MCKLVNEVMIWNDPRCRHEKSESKEGMLTGLAILEDTSLKTTGLLLTHGWKCLANKQKERIKHMLETTGTFKKRKQQGE